MKRHFMFYLYPWNGRDWRWHVNKIRAHRGAFNGKCAIIIATDDRTEDINVVRQEVSSLGFEVFEERNNKKLPMVSEFHKHLEFFKSTNRDEAVFFGHSKGVSHIQADGSPNLSTLSWAETMFKLNLDCPTLVDKLLERYKAVGAFKYFGPHGGAPWHYAGTFFWLRCDALYSRDWRTPSNDYFDVEGFPGRIVKDEDAFCLGPSVHQLPGNLYNITHSKDSVGQWLKELRERFSI